MTKVLSSLLYRIWLIAASIIVLFAILISIGRALIPYANNYKHHLEQTLSNITGQEVTIEEISTEWKSLGPSITLQGVEIKNTLTIESFNTEIKTIPSIFYQTLITENLVLDGLELIVEQQLDGSLSLAGQAGASNQTQTESFDYKLLQDWLQSQTEITISQASIKFNLRNGDSFPINISEMGFSRGVNLYQMQGFTELPGENRIDFVFEANGLLTDPETEGQLYIDTHQLDLTEIPLDAFWQEARIVDGEVKLNAWIDWQNLRFDKAIATLELADFQMTLQNAPQGNLNLISTQLLWQQYDDGWQLQTNDASVTSNQRTWPSPFVQIRMRQGEDFQQQYYLRSSRMDVGVWADLLLARQNLDASLRERLLVMDPQGFLDAVQIDAIFSPEELVDINLTARFSEIGFKPFGATPGISNMAGQIQLLDDSGSLYLDSRFAEFIDPEMFRWTLPLDYINTDIDWSITEQQLDLTIQHFTSHIHGAKLKTDGSISIPFDDRPIQMDLYAELTDGDMAMTPRFLPYGIMDSELVDYLDDSILSGQLTDVKILLRGSSEDFPYSNNQGVFAIHGKVGQSDVKFDPNWPTLKQMQAELFFIGNGMNVKVSSAESYLHQVNNAQVQIIDFSKQPELLIKSNSQGNLSDAGAFILNSPLNDAIFPVIDALAMSGSFELDLDLEIPLSEDDAKVVGEIRLNDADLVVKQIGLPANNINGSLQIDNGLVEAKNINAKILGGDSRIDMTQSSTESGLDTQLSIRGDLVLSSVYEVFGDLIPKGLDGTTGFSATVSLPSTENQFDIVIDTQTVGMTSVIPYPLSKTANINIPLQLQYQKVSATESELEISWLDKFSMLMAYENEELSAGIMALGTNEVSLPERPGIAITGIADTVDLVAWLDYLTDLEQTAQDDDESSYDQYYLDNLSISQLTYFFLTFSDTKVSGNFGIEQLDFLLEGQDIQGTITVPLPFGQAPIDIDLERLQIADLLADEESSETEVERVADANPLPPISLNCKTCIYAGHQLGNTNINLKPMPNGNEVDIKISQDNILSLDVLAKWYEAEELVYTDISGKAKTRNLGRLLDILNQDAGIRDTPMEITGDLRWQGDPSMFNMDSLNGKLVADGGKGSQRQLSDRKARIFSIFSLGSIARRLTLDFSDLFEDGFFYTGMDGTLVFRDGVMRTDDLSVRGTSAGVQVRGEVNFPKNKIEQCILVTPDLSSSLPVLAGWAIEPVTGFFVFLMSKMFQPAIDVVSSIQYQVEGSFDDPTVTEIGKSRAKATVSEDEENPSITVEESELPFSCDNQFN